MEHSTMGLTCWMRGMIIYDVRFFHNIFTQWIYKFTFLLSDQPGSTLCAPNASSAKMFSFVGRSTSSVNHFRCITAPNSPLNVQEVVSPSTTSNGSYNLHAEQKWSPRKIICIYVKNVYIYIVTYRIFKSINRYYCIRIRPVQVFSAANSLILHQWPVRFDPPNSACSSQFKDADPLRCRIWFRRPWMKKGCMGGAVALWAGHGG